MALLLTYQKTAECFDDAFHAAFFPSGYDKIYFVIMGLLVTIVYALGGIGLISKKEGEKDNAEQAASDKVGGFIFVGVAGLYMLLIWLFEKMLEIDISAIIIVIVFVFLNFGVAFLVVWLSKMPKFSKTTPAKRALDTDEKTIGQMFKNPKYICLLFIFLFIQGCSYQYNKRLPKLAVEA